MTEITYKELLAQRQALEAQIAEARKIEVSKALETVRQLVADFELTMDEVFPISNAQRRRGAPKGGPVAIKYRNAETGETWTGRGKPPRWIADKDRSQFAV
jgi:DNA-binding protein H-NS